MLINLSGKWRLKNEKFVLDGNVPGDVSDDFFRAGLIKDPYFNNDFEQSRWITLTDWCYEKNFQVRLSELDENTYLRFDGIDTFSEVYLNGVEIGKTANMHRAYQFPVNGLLREGDNVLSVHLHNIYEVMGQQEQEKYSSIFHANRIFVRKAQCHFGWDWAPRFPGYGIYRDVMLISEKRATVESVAVEAALSGDVNFRIAFGDKFQGKLDLQICLDGQCVACKTLTVAAKKLLTNLHIEEPLLWWPNGYGEHPVYEYILSQHFTDGVTKHRGTFGFRKVELDKSVIDGDNLRFSVRVNGRPIFCRGSNWVPADCMTGRLKDEKYFELVKSAAEANFNMLRIWGGGIYEKDCFYEYCDRMGILVWQEFMFACSEIPEDNLEFIQEITREAEFQVKRLRNHPCLALWCGMNEIRGAFSEEEERYSVFTLHYLLRGITGQLSPWIPYERSSPFAFADVENDICEGDCHRNLSEPCLFDQSFSGFDEVVYQEGKAWEQMRERIKNYERFLPETKSNFTSECAVLGMCSFDSLRKFTPAEELSLQSSFFRERFMGNPYTYIMPTFFERQQKLAEGMYGKIENLKDLIKKVNLSQADILRTEIVYCRSNERSWGILNWMFNDIWPTGTWSVIDYYLDKKPAYYVMRRSFVPQMLALLRVGDDYFLCCANDSQQTLERTVLV
ncbi:MAG: glycoside hydrolase family 2 protein, partial [Lachnospiraceae bacterium]|nr:glycoside hydrolase family 2 protein [Lachnospiraceae bacterium]